MIRVLVLLLLVVKNHLMCSGKLLLLKVQKLKRLQNVENCFGWALATHMAWSSS